MIGVAMLLVLGLAVAPPVDTPSPRDAAAVTSGESPSSEPPSGESPSSEPPSGEPPSSESPSSESPSSESRPDAPPPGKSTPAEPRSTATRRWSASGPWVPNAWPTQQSCALDPVDAPWCLLIRADVFTGARIGTIGGAQQSEFRLDRAEAATGLLWKPATRFETGGIVALESIRSAGPQSVTGIDGDSLIVRLLEAYGHAAAHFGPIDVGLRAGLVPERWIEQVEKGYDTRGFDALASDRVRMFDRADIGASLVMSGWDSRADLDLEIVNGEGRAQRERNRGKNTTAIVTVRPVLRAHPRGPIVLALHGGFRDGSVGIASIADRRGAAAVSFASPWVYGGVEYVHALGFGGRGDVRANTLGVWASGRILPRWLGVMAKYDRVVLDLEAPDSTIHVVGCAAFSDVFEHIDRNRRRVRVYAGYQFEGYGQGAAPLPGATTAQDAHRFLLQLELRGLARIGPKEQRP